MVQGSVKTFGVKEFSSAASEVDQAAEDIRLLGYTVVSDALTATELESARAKMDGIYAQQLDEIGGEQQLAAINDTYTARCMLAYDEFFLTVATNPKVLAIVQRFLGDYFVLMLQNGVINIPSTGNEQNAGSWHRDLNYQHFISTRPISVSALFCVDDFSEETGGTFVLPASHKTEAFPSEEFVRQHEQVINAKAGSAIVFDSMMYHRGGLNRSPHPRRAINHMYTLPFVKQQISLPRMLDGKYRDDAFLNRFLGYESETDASVVEFRRRRLKRL
ncbi:MAG TPA: phytanoyl-CoA dioxygenase family protein [Pyrinomonadaceae bacterium]|nr:phytanoyl-CoA dioxygenase family protein [Pyrinomonadaceae bacterium]